jgi:hypothetical protein
MNAITRRRLPDDHRSTGRNVDHRQRFGADPSIGTDSGSELTRLRTKYRACPSPVKVGVESPGRVTPVGKGTVETRRPSTDQIPTVSIPTVSEGSSQAATLLESGDQLGSHPWNELTCRPCGSTTKIRLGPSPCGALANMRYRPSRDHADAQ